MREKTGGRTKGVKNKITAEVKAKFDLIVNANLDRIQNDLDALTPRWRVHYLIELTKFVLPTLKAADIELNTNEENEIKHITVNIISNADTD